MNIAKILHQLRRHATINNAALALALIVALSWLWGTVTTLQKNFVLQQRVDALDQQIEIADIENANLGFMQQYYRSAEYLELSARERLGKALPGEHVILLPVRQEEAPVVEVERPVPLRLDEASNFQQWMRFFFGQDTNS